MSERIDDQRGWTLIEIMFALAFLATVVLGGLAVWAIIHFVAKVW